MAAKKSLREAALFDDAAEIRRLLAKASDPQRRDMLGGDDRFYGRTALHFAALRGHQDCVAALLDGAGEGREGAMQLREVLHAKDFGMNTAMHLAAAWGHESCAAAMLARIRPGEERDQLLHARDNMGQLAWQRARDNNQLRSEVKRQMMKFLREAEAADSRWEQAKSRLQAAVLDGRVMMLQSAMEEALTAGVDTAALEAAQQVFQQRREMAVKAVAAAARRGSVALLRAAMTEAVVMERSASGVEEARFKKVLQRMAEVTLEAATEDGSLASLRLAVAEAERVGVEDSSLEVARKLLVLLRNAAERALAHAMREEESPPRSLATSRPAANTAEASASKLEAAKAIVSALQRKVKAEAALRAAKSLGVSADSPTAASHDQRDSRAACPCMEEAVEAPRAADVPAPTSWLDGPCNKVAPLGHQVREAVVAPLGQRVREEATRQAAAAVGEERSFEDVNSWLNGPAVDIPATWLNGPTADVPVVEDAHFWLDGPAADVPVVVGDVSSWLDGPMADIPATWLDRPAAAVPATWLDGPLGKKAPLGQEEAMQQAAVASE